MGEIHITYYTLKKNKESQGAVSKVINIAECGMTYLSTVQQFTAMSHGPEGNLQCCNSIVFLHVSLTPTSVSCSEVTAFLALKKKFLKIIR